MKQMYSLLLPALLSGLLWHLPARGQLALQRQVTASSGGSGLIGNILIQYTIGEPVVATFSAGNSMLTQGFQQPELPPLPPGKDPIINYILYPNPASTTVKVQFELLTPGAVLFRLVNSAGQQMFQQFRHYGPGQVIIPIPVNRFAAGIYTVMLNINGKVFFEKLIIQ
ncbi:T9SS type A sorting domain-containing protein [Chitinophaga japonensis]|uniref:Putative secreted protein (Por secretion system target) n=1 Tax=Chitinophaga japonensis TaxID=104662 RepID=A0A562T3F6_CHIJA|nr:T9SS type A sorting domain-containing protein [Chitinophaga japonensis]TWI88099.1 putative secreted protein (Por secretion system target) [Chitinophaga japonensis]